MRINALYLLVLLAVSCKDTTSPKPAVYSTTEGAINGYDVVAYFIEGKPVKGFDSLSFTWNDARWKFSSQSNLDSFKNNTKRFAPKYGGYCAYGLSRNYKAQTSPDAWSIVRNQLYLNYNKDVQMEWKKDMEKRIAEADKNWPEIADK